MYFSKQLVQTALHNGYPAKASSSKFLVNLSKVNVYVNRHLGTIRMTSPSVIVHKLSPVFTNIFNSSLETCHVPAGFKSSIITPVPKKPWATGLNDYRPVTLTYVVSLLSALCWHTSNPSQTLFWTPCSWPKVQTGL